MFPKMSLDLVILSIIDEHPEGIKGYALMKELERRFGEDLAPGPGALYPRLDKLKKDGLLDENDKLWTVSPSGKKHLQEQVPDVLSQSLDFMPQLYKFLVKTIPFGRRLDFLSNQIHPGDCRSHHCSPRPGLFDAESIAHDIDDIPDEGKSIKRLQDIKERLGGIKHDAEEQLKTQLAAIDGVLKAIDDKIARCEAEKASWRRIPIEDGSFGSKDS